VSPTGGALLGTEKEANVIISDSPPPPRSPSGSGGGGSFGWLGALLLGLAGALRRRLTGDR
jgi:MYXO-CTERM domain-containing protein